MRTRSIVVAVVLACLWPTQALTQDSAATDRQLFTDDPGASWRIQATADVLVDQGAETEVFAGSNALGIEVVDDTIYTHIVEFTASPPVAAEPFWALRFAFHPGTAVLIPPAASSRIAFQSFRDERWDIYSATTAGDSLANLTRSPSADRGPSWSADGSRLVFHSQRAGDFNLYTSRPDGNEQTPLTTGSDVDAFPAWSPIGGLVAFHSNRNGNFDIFVVDSEGGQLVAVTTSTATDWFPTWAPDGERLAFQSDRTGNHELFTVARTGGELVQLTDDPAADEWPVGRPPAA